MAMPPTADPEALAPSQGDAGRPSVVTVTPVARTEPTLVPSHRSRVTCPVIVIMKPKGAMRPADFHDHDHDHGSGANVTVTSWFAPARLDR